MTAFRWWRLTGVIQVLKLLSSMSGHWGRCSQYNRYTALWSKHPKHNQKHSKSFGENSDVTRLRWMTSSRLFPLLLLFPLVRLSGVRFSFVKCFSAGGHVSSSCSVFTKAKKWKNEKTNKRKSRQNNYNTLAKMLKIYKIIHRSLSI